MITRRQILKVGAASMVVTGAGLGLFGVTRRPSTALTPWQEDAHNYQDPRLQALSYAILAPNPHNRQPWRAELVGEFELMLTCDLDRRLPHTDPFDRQITIGLGCFLELFVMAAGENGFATEISYFPDGEPESRLDERVIARLVLSRSQVAKDPLFAFVKSRRSNKEPYDVSKQVADAALDEILRRDSEAVLIGGTNAAERVDTFRSLSWRAHEIESYTPRTMQESIDLMRIGKDEINANPDGIDLGGFGIELFAKLGFVDRELMADPTSTAFKQGLDIYYELMHSAMAYVWITTPDNSRHSQLEAGRAWIRLNLRATGRGIAVQPLSQALQEYVEMDALFAEIHRELGVALPARIQMFGRIGYGREIGPSPRWPMENSLVRQA